MIASENLIDLDKLDGKLQKAYAYWCQNPSEDRPLSRKDIDPLDLIKLLPNIELLKILFDKEGNITDFKYDLVGEQIESHAQKRRYGQCLSEILHQNESSHLFKCLKYAATHSTPLALKMEYMGSDPRISHAEGIILPLVEQAQHAESLLIAVNFIQK